MSRTYALEPAGMGAAVEIRSARGMVVAKKTETVRGEDGRDERLIAGVSRVDADHWLVRTYPHLFAAERSTRTRAKGARRRTATRATATTPRRPIALPRKPLIRVSESSTVKVELRADAYQHMGDHAYFPGSDVETGGGLFGYAYSPKTNTIVIREALGPGPTSRARHGVVWLDGQAITDRAERYKRDGSSKVVVGLWHSHVRPDDPGEPSDTDMRSWAGRGIEHFIGLILTPTWGQDRTTFESYASWAKPTVHAWHMHHVGDDQFIVARAEVVRC